MGEGAGRVRRLAARRSIVLAALAVPWLTGCALLGLPPDWDSEFPEPAVVARYTRGSATIELEGGETIVLGTVAPGAALTDFGGTAVRWTGDSGWHLSLSGAGAESFFGIDDGFLQFDRLTDNQHWTTFDPTRCVIDIEVADESGLRGSATCRGVRWYDALDTSSWTFGSEPDALDEPAFDAEVTFEALPRPPSG